MPIPAKDEKKTVRLRPEMWIFISNLAKDLNISENDAIKMIIHEYIRNTK